jgi:hypothetical protein
MSDKLVNPESLEKERISLASEALTKTSEQACEPLEKKRMGLHCMKSRKDRTCKLVQQ